MTVSVVVAALFASLTVALAVAVIAPPRRALAGRLRPYVSLSRSRLGTGSADASVVSLTLLANDRHAMAKVFGPLVDAMAGALSSVVDVADDDTLTQRLRHAGFGETSAEQYRMRQLAWTIGGIAIGQSDTEYVVGEVQLDRAAQPTGDEASPSD